jgi:hypothetical protein
MAGVNGLVAFPVGGRVRARDVRRQRHVAEALEQAGQSRTGAAETEKRAVATDHFEPAAVLEHDPPARPQRLAHAQLGEALAVVEQALEHDLHPAAGFLAAEQARGNHPGVVEDQQVARGQQSRQIAKSRIRHDPAVPVEAQQAAGRTLRQRLLRDQLGRQIEMEVTQFQAGHGGTDHWAARVYRPHGKIARAWL